MTPELAAFYVPHDASCNRCGDPFACDAYWRWGWEGWEHRCNDATIYATHPGRIEKKPNG